MDTTNLNDSTIPKGIPSGITSFVPETGIDDQYKQLINYIPKGLRDSFEFEPESKLGPTLSVDISVAKQAWSTFLNAKDEIEKMMWQGMQFDAKTNPDGFAANLQQFMKSTGNPDFYKSRIEAQELDIARNSMLLHHDPKMGQINFTDAWRDPRSFFGTQLPHTLGSIAALYAEPLVIGTTAFGVSTAMGAPELGAALISGIAAIAAARPPEAFSEAQSSVDEVMSMLNDKYPDMPEEKKQQLALEAFNHAYNGTMQLGLKDAAELVVAFIPIRGAIRPFAKALSGGSGIATRAAINLAKRPLLEAGLELGIKIPVVSQMEGLEEVYQKRKSNEAYNLVAQKLGEPEKITSWTDLFNDAETLNEYKGGLLGGLFMAGGASVLSRTAKAVGLVGKDMAYSDIKNTMLKQQEFKSHLISKAVMTNSGIELIAGIERMGEAGLFVENPTGDKQKDISSSVQRAKGIINDIKEEAQYIEQLVEQNPDIKDFRVIGQISRNNNEINQIKSSIRNLNEEEPASKKIIQSSENRIEELKKETEQFLSGLTWKEYIKSKEKTEVQANEIETNQPGQTDQFTKITAKSDNNESNQVESNDIEDTEEDLPEETDEDQTDNVERVWKNAKDIKEGDLIQTSEGKYSKVTAINKNIDETIESIETEDGKLQNIYKNKNDWAVAVKVPKEEKKKQAFVAKSKTGIEELQRVKSNIDNELEKKKEKVKEAEKRFAKFDVDEILDNTEFPDMEDDSDFVNNAIENDEDFASMYATHQSIIKADSISRNYGEIKLVSNPQAELINKFLKHKILGKEEVNEFIESGSTKLDATHLIQRGIRRIQYMIQNAENEEEANQFKAMRSAANAFFQTQKDIEDLNSIKQLSDFSEVKDEESAKKKIDDIEEYLKTAEKELDKLKSKKGRKVADLITRIQRVKTIFSYAKEIAKQYGIGVEEDSVKIEDKYVAEDPQKIIDAIEEDQKKILEVSSKGYLIQISDKVKKWYKRVTSLFYNKAVNETIGEEESIQTPATIAGNTVDNIVRDFFAGKKYKSYKGISDEALNALNESLIQIEKTIKKNGEKFITRMANPVKYKKDGQEAIKDDYTLIDENKEVAGSLDILVVTSDGRFKIYDIKTSKDFSNYYKQTTLSKPVTINGKKETRISSKAAIHRKQLSAYSNIFFNRYGIKISEIGVLPYQIDYDENGNITELNEAHGLEDNDALKYHNGLPIIKLVHDARVDEEHLPIIVKPEIKETKKQEDKTTEQDNEKLSSEQSKAIDDVFESNPEIVEIFNNDKQLYQEYLDSQNIIDESEITYTDEEGNPCAAMGARSSKFTKGSQWQLYEIFEGKSHSQGGIDISVKNGKINYTNKSGTFEAKYGLVIPNK